MPETILIPDLTAIDRYELEKLLSSSDVTFDEHELQSGEN